MSPSNVDLSKVKGAEEKRDIVVGECLCVHVCNGKCNRA